MALIILFSIKHYNSNRPTILSASFGLIENGARYGNRTHLFGLEGRRTSRCTNPAYGYRRFLEENRRNSKSLIFACTHSYALVPQTGLEPVRSFEHMILSHGWLPITPLGHIIQDSKIKNSWSYVKPHNRCKLLYESYMAEEVGAAPTSPVLETGAFAAMLLLNICELRSQRQLYRFCQFAGFNRRNKSLRLLSMAGGEGFEPPGRVYAGTQAFKARPL